MAPRKLHRTPEADRMLGPLAKTARALSNHWSVEVIFTGTRCETDGQRIFLPYNADYLGEDKRQLIHGNLDHETAHVAEERRAKEARRATPLTIMRAEKRNTVRLLFNAFEDIRIERRYGAIYPGVAENLRAINARSVEVFYTRHGKGAKNFWHQFACAIIGQARGFDIGWCPEAVTAWLPLAEPELAKVAKAEWADVCMECAQSLYTKVRELALSMKSDKSDDEDDDEGGGKKPELAISTDDDEPCESEPEPEDDEDEDEVVHMDLREEPPKKPESKPEDEDGDADDEEAGGDESEDGDEDEDESSGAPSAGGSADEAEGEDDGEGEGDEDGDESEDNEPEGDDEGSDGDPEGDDESEDGDSDAPAGGDDSGEGDEDGEDGDDEEAGGAGGGSEGDTEGDDTDEDAEGEGEDTAADESTSGTDEEASAESDAAPEGADLDEYDPSEHEATETDMVDTARRDIEEHAREDAETHRRYMPHPACLALDRWYTPNEHLVGNPTALAEYAAGKEIVREQIGTMRSKLLSAIRVMAASRTVSDQESGALDAASLHQVRQGNRRVFASEVKGETLDTAVEILLDLSGSMGPRREPCKSYYTWLMAIALGETFDALNVPFEMVGFHNNMGRMPREAIKYGDTAFYQCREPFDYLVFKSWDERLRRCRERFSAIGGYQDNADGEAVRAVGKRLAMRPEKRKMMFVVSDGEPAAAYCDFSKLNADLKDAVKSLTRAGIEVFGIGVQTESVRRFYNESTGASSIVVHKIDSLAIEVYRAMRARLIRRRAA